MVTLRGFAGLALLCATHGLFAQEAALRTDSSPSPTTVLETEAYLKPPPQIERLVMAPRWENVSLSDLSPDRSRFLVMVSDGMPTLAQLGKPHVNLGGFQVDTVANRSRNITIRECG